jgi:lipopolysaccharide/colanic/teichoic acid biosynthesis glycosyltransferase
MNRIYLQKLLFTTTIELTAVFSAFFIAYSLRAMRDWIPYIQLPIPYISYDQFLPFVISGVIVWGITFTWSGLYSLREHTPIIEEIRLVLIHSTIWFFIYIGFIYLSTWFLFIHEIPRLIILYTYFIATLLSIIIRYTIYSISNYLYKIWKINKNTILVINNTPEKTDLNEKNYYTYIYKSMDNQSEIETLIREKNIYSIVYIGDHSKIWNVFTLSKIYWIPLMYPKISKYMPLNSIWDTWLWGIPMIELSSVSITAWGRIVKRSFDIVFSSISIIILIPVCIIASIWVYISDPTGPIIYKNRRIGQNGKIFSLYKFRYMYWKYCIKEEYGIEDEAISYEEKLKQEKNTREWPLYKIENDPRKMPWGRYLERLSIDELPQLYNVLKWDMSIIWPRPHQPREIDLYDESDKQVLTVKPGITGMAQVYGRDKNTFKNEIMLDTYYIEHYSTTLDLSILLRTFFVVFVRFFVK